MALSGIRTIKQLQEFTLDRTATGIVLNKYLDLKIHKIN
jgi:hypothetical protein